MDASADASLPQEPILKVVVRQSLRVVRVGLVVSVYWNYDGAVSVFARLLAIAGRPTSLFS
jgi:hypothetical protein